MTRPIAFLLVLVCAGCEHLPTGPTNSSPGSDGLADNLTFCVAETNRYRAMAGVAAVSRSDEIEAHAASAAESDGISNTAHAYSRANATGQWAENAVLRWRISWVRSVRDVIGDAIGTFWRQGAGGGHYQNLTGPYNSVGCGVYVSGNNVTVVQHFRR